MKNTYDDEVAERLLTLANKADDESALDELVHDTKSREASDINNGGFDEQIRYLLSAGFSEGEIRQQLED